MKKAKLDCAEACRRLDDYVDRELSDAEIAAVDEHLAFCEDCAGEFAVERELLDCIREKLKSVRVPPGLRAKIAERLEQLE
jgi:anti-sigma factor (TIGR02949 family)